MEPWYSNSGFSEPEEFVKMNDESYMQNRNPEAYKSPDGITMYRFESRLISNDEYHKIMEDRDYISSIVDQTVKNLDLKNKYLF